jgi:hypothetical protein
MRRRRRRRRQKDKGRKEEMSIYKVIESPKGN